MAADARPIATTALLRAAEREAENLYFGVRCAALLALTAFYVVAGDGHHHARIAGATLLAFTALTLALRVLPVRWREAAPVVYAGAIADVVFVTLQLVLLALSAGAPREHLFALPPAILLFLVVGQHVLRSRPGVVLAAGTAGSLALAAILAAWRPTPEQALMVHPEFGYWAPLVPIVLFLLTLVLWAQARRTRVLLDRAVRAAQTQGNLARFFSPKVVDRIAALELIRPLNGARRQVAVLFVDIRGFTALSERLPPERLGELLVEFRSLVTACVFGHDGNIDKFLGDGVLIVYGAPEPRPDAADAALSCARHLLSELASWSDKREALGHEPIRVAIGAHFGTVFAGVLGGAAVAEFTVIGDTVNVAQRLQRVATIEGAELAISGAFRDALREPLEPREWSSEREVDLPGRSGAVEVLLSMDRHEHLPRLPRAASPIATGECA